MGHRRCDICGQSLPKGGKLYCHTCWEECMIRVKGWTMETNLNIRYGVRLPGYISTPKVTREIEVNDDRHTPT